MLYHKLYFRKIGDRDKFPPMELKDNEYQLMKEFLKDPDAKFIEIKNCIVQKKDIDYIGEPLEKTFQKDTDEYGRPLVPCWRCDYGLWHDMKTGEFVNSQGNTDWSAMYCGCKEKIGLTPEAYFQECKILFNIDDPKQLTFQMGKDYLRLKEQQKNEI
jgi:hypothetical protein